MNYIVLSEWVESELTKEHDRYNRDFLSLDEYLQDKLSLDGDFFLNRWHGDKGSYIITGRNAIFYADVHRKNQNCLYVTGMQSSDEKRRYRNFSNLIKLPGTWTVIVQKLFRGENCEDACDIAGILENVLGSRKAYYRFEEEWKKEQEFTARKTAAAIEQEEATIRLVKSVEVEDNVYTITVEKWCGKYAVQTEIKAKRGQNGRFELLGRVIDLNETDQTLRIQGSDKKVSEEDSLKHGIPITEICVSNSGTLALLRRESKVLESIFMEETANPNLKNILMDDVDWESSEIYQATEDEIRRCHQFGNNIIQTKAYLGAIHASDLYMIQGPPGTGKTTIISEMVRYGVTNHLDMLIVSETHVAVDNVLEKTMGIEGIVPIRLGREESIEPVGRQFLPDHIVDTMLSESRAAIEELEKNGSCLEQLLEQKRRTGAKQIEKYNRKIELLEAKLAYIADKEGIFDRIEGYIELAKELNLEYQTLENKRTEYINLSDRKAALMKRKVSLEVTMDYRHMENRELRAIKEMNRMKEGGGRSESEEGEYRTVLKSLSEIEEGLSRNGYEAALGRYQRRIKRAKREKQALTGLLQPKQSLMTCLRDLRQCHADVVLLRAQKEQYEEQLALEVEKMKADYKRKERLWNRTKDIRADWMDSMEDSGSRRRMGSLYNQNVNVVFSTCTGIASSWNGEFADKEYDYVIVDEAAKCASIDLLIPLVRGKKIILVGDHKQLAPMLEEEMDDGTEEYRNLKKEIEEHILFKKLYEERVPEGFKSMLTRQYRMPFVVSEFVSKSFYEGKLECEKEETDRGKMIWISCKDAVEKQMGTSYVNDLEAETVVRLLAHLDGGFLEKKTVGIICIYKQQAQLIRRKIAGKHYDNIEIECNTVDAYQGKEKQVIILNLVRSKVFSSFGKNENRLNVAVSRCQEELYIVGSRRLAERKDAEVLGKLYSCVKLYGRIEEI